MPESDSFLEQWHLGPEEWFADRGQLLRESASLFESFGNSADAYGTRLRAIPLAEADAPHEISARFWDAMQTVRDIVELGDPEDRPDGGIGTENDACQSMRLAFGLGLMMLDCIVDSNSHIVGERRTALESLFALLTSAAREMSSIDRFDRTYWGDALRHVAIRRVIWSEGADTVAATFGKEAKPSFTDCIVTLTTDTENLFALIPVALRNKVQPKTPRPGRHNQIVPASLRRSRFAKGAQIALDIMPSRPSQALRRCSPISRSIRTASLSRTGGFSPSTKPASPPVTRVIALTARTGSVS
jgi:hypothetical protein